MTTVALRKETLTLLAQLKHEQKAPSFDALIQSLIQSTKKRKPLLFGAFKDLPPFKREELDRFD